MEKITVKKNSRILFIGDSITDVKFNFRFNSRIKGRKIYALQLKKKFRKYSKDIHVDIKGIASNRTYHLYDRLTKDCIDLKPDIIIMLIGVNDAWENYVPDQYPPNPRRTEPHIREIYRRFKEELPDAKVLYLMPFMIDSVPEKLPFHEKLDEYREMLREIAEENGAVIVDLQEAFYKAQEEFEPCKLAVDAIHPTNLGHRVMAEAIERVLNFE